MDVFFSFHRFVEPFWNQTVFLIGFLLFLYALPCLRLITLPFFFPEKYFFSIAKILGYWERLASILRKSIGLLFLMMALFWCGLDGISLEQTSSLFYIPGILFLIALTWYMHQEQTRTRLFFLEFVAEHSSMHPKEFFARYTACFSPLRLRFPEKPTTVVSPYALDFRQTKTNWFPFPLVMGLMSTITIAKLLMLAYRHKGGKFLQKVAPSGATMWGLRLMQLTQSALTVSGSEHLAQQPKYALYLFNHESFLEFAIAPLVLGKQLPRFLLARDHFLKNPFLYRILGIGKVAEALDMVFVDRSHVKTKEEKILRARKTTAEAVKKLLDDHIPLAMFPQGTRARSTVSATGKRLGAGYYTAGKHDRLSVEGGHLKKGAAYIALNAAIELKQRKRDDVITLFPIGVTGAAVVCPRKSFRVQYGASIHLQVEQPILITEDMVRTLTLPREDEAPSLAYQEEIHDLVSTIDRNLVLALKLHGELEGRFLELVRERRDANLFDEVFVALREWRGKDDPLLYVLLDFIFACPSKKWRPFVNQLIYLLTHQAPREQFVELQQILADELCNVKNKKSYRRLNFRTVS